MAQEIPVGATVELRNSKEDWRVVSYWDNEVPKFCRQYMIQSLHTGQTKRAFKHEIFEKKNTSSYKDIYDFFREQMSQEIQEDFLDNSLSENNKPGPDEPEFGLQDLLLQQDSATLPDSPQLTSHEPPKQRFKTVTDDDVENLASKTTEATTNSMTKWVCKIIQRCIPNIHVQVTL